jgi:hypothetical protein
MADALRLTTSVSGLMSIADIIVRKGYTYIKDAKDAGKTVEKLVDEVNNLSGMLHSLRNVPDWPCPYCPTVVMVAWEETGDDETTRRREAAGGSTLVPGRWGAAADGKFEKPALYATHTSGLRLVAGGKIARLCVHIVSCALSECTLLSTKY